MSYWKDYVFYCNSVTSQELPNFCLLGLSLAKEIVIRVIKQYKKECGKR